MWRGAFARLLVAGSLLGCDAAFEDLRSELEPEPEPELDLGVPDVDFPDAGGPIDLGLSDAATDAGIAGGGDANAADAEPIDASMPQEQVLFRGVWERVDYAVSGTVRIVRLPSGALELRFGSDFRTASVPGPVVVVARRGTIAPRIRADLGDLRLGRLTANAGAQTYPLPASAAEATHVIVFCEPFGLDVGRAPLVPGP